MYNAFWRHGLFVRGQSFSVKIQFDSSRNCCQVIGEGAGNDFRGPSVQALPLFSRFSFSSAGFFYCPLLPSACYAGYRVDEVVSWTPRFLTRKFWIKNRSLFMINKFKRKCLQKFYVWSKQEKEWDRKTTYYLEQPSRHFCQHFMRRTTQQTL